MADPKTKCPRCRSVEWFPGAACFDCRWEGSAAEAYEMVVGQLEAFRDPDTVEVSAEQRERSERMRPAILEITKGRDLLAEIAELERRLHAAEYAWGRWGSHYSFERALAEAQLELTRKERWTGNEHQRTTRHRPRRLFGQSAKADVPPGASLCPNH